MTPEGKVKDLTKKFLASRGLIASAKAPEVKPHHTGWYHMVVPLPMGVMGMPDFIGHYKGRFFAVETKIPGKDPTPLQRHQLKALDVTRAFISVVRCEEDLKILGWWMDLIDQEA